MRLSNLVLVASTVLLASSASAATTQEERLRRYHAQLCPTELPCNYCSSVTGHKIPVVPSSEPWGADCRFTSPDGWQDGKVYTIYPDKPFTVNYKK